MSKKLFTAFAVFIAMLGPTTVAFANPSYFANGTSTAAATTTKAYMTAGNATTTTPVFDAYAQVLSGGATSKADYAGLLVQFAASSTNTILSANVEYSQDGIDWYRNYLVDPNQIATSTGSGTFSVATPFAFSWKFASSSVNGLPPATTSNQATAALLIPTPFRYTRVWFAVTGANGAVWAQIVPVKERQ